MPSSNPGAKNWPNSESSEPLTFDFIIFASEKNATASRSTGAYINWGTPFEQFLHFSLMLFHQPFSWLLQAHVTSKATVSSDFKISNVSSLISSRRRLLIQKRVHPSTLFGHGASARISAIRCCSPQIIHVDIYLI